MRNANRQADVWAALAFGALWGLMLALSPAAMTQALVDDAYIFQRVVDNLINGHGWTYNPGTQVNPITSPLFAVILWAAHAIPMDDTARIAWVYLAANLLLGWGLYQALREQGRMLAWTAAAVITTSGVLVASWGMETSLFLACVVLAALAYVKDRHLLAGVLSALAALTRPEGLALVGVLAAAHWWVHRRVLWGMVLINLLVVAPWFTYSWLTFGHALPNSVSVKAIQHNIGWFKTQPPWGLYFLTQPRRMPLTYVLVAVGLWQVLRWWRAGVRFPGLVLAFGLVQVAAYSLMGAPVGYFWYLAPGNLALDLAAVAGAFWLAQQALARVGASGPRWSWLPSVAVMVGMLRLAMTPFVPVTDYRLGAEYAAAGRWIDQNTRPDEVVAATEIGYLGYFSKREIRDIHGLIHPESLPHLKKEEWDWWFVHKPPSVVVVHTPAWSGEPSIKMGWQPDNFQQFQARYAKAASFGQIEVYRLKP